MKDHERSNYGQLPPGHSEPDWPKYHPRGSPVYGGLLLAVYALGMAVPLFVLALLWDRFDLGRRRWLRGRQLRAGRLRLHTTSLLSGLFFIALGTIFIVFDGTTSQPGPLSVDESFAAEQWAARTGGAVPDWALLTDLVAGEAIALAVRGRRRRGAHQNGPRRRHRKELTGRAPGRGDAGRPGDQPVRRVPSGSGWRHGKGPVHGTGPSARWLGPGSNR